MGKIQKYKTEVIIILPTIIGLLTFGIFVPIIFLYIYYNFVRIILRIRAEHISFH